MRRIVTLAFILVAAVPAISHASLERSRPVKPLSPEESRLVLARLQERFGVDLARQSQGSGKLADLGVEIDGPVAIPLAQSGPATDNYLPCGYIFIYPNQTVPVMGQAPWLLTVSGHRGWLGGKTGGFFPYGPFAVNIAPGGFFYVAYPVWGCANFLEVWYQWNRPGEAWIYKHWMTANLGAYWFTYPLIAPGTVFNPGPMSRGGDLNGAVDTLSVLNAGEAFCDGEFDPSGTCLGTSLPPEDVDISFVGELGGQQIPSASPAGLGLVAVALGVAGLIVAARRRRASAA